MRPQCTAGPTVCQGARAKQHKRMDTVTGSSESRFEKANSSESLNNSPTPPLSKQCLPSRSTFKDAAGFSGILFSFQSGSRKNGAFRLWNSECVLAGFKWFVIGIVWIFGNCILQGKNCVDCFVRSLSSENHLMVFDIPGPAKKVGANLFNPSRCSE